MRGSRSAWRFGYASRSSWSRALFQAVVFTPDMLRGMAAAYLAGTDPRSPLPSPLSADLKGLPPRHRTMTERAGDDPRLVGRAELLFSDSERLAAAATDAWSTSRPDRGRTSARIRIMLGTPEADAVTEERGKFLSARVR